MSYTLTSPLMMGAALRNLPTGEQQQNWLLKGCGVSLYWFPVK